MRHSNLCVKNRDAVLNIEGGNEMMVQSEYSLQNCNQVIDLYLSADPEPWEPSRLQDIYQVVSLILKCRVVFENDKIGTIF